MERFCGIKGMKGITRTMTLTTGNLVQLQRRPVETGSSGLAEDKDAFLTYLLPVKKHLYNFIRKALNFSAEADDIFQETLLKGFRYFYSFDRRKNFKTWLFTIAHNLLKDAHRERNLPHWPVPLAEEGEILLESDQPDISTQVREIYAEVARLKPRQRDVFYLYYYNEFDIAEIAEITGLTRVNIKFILHQARSTIKKILEVQR